MRVIVLMAALAVLPRALFGAEFHHVHLRSEDPPAAARWYAENLGGHAGQAAGFEAAAFDGVTLLFAAANRPGPDGTPAPERLVPSSGSAVDHLGFSMPDLEASLSRLAAAGAEIVQPARQVGALFSYAFITDPWGQKVEIIDDAETRGLHHVHLLATDAEAAAAWYAAQFGGEVTHFKGLEPLPAVRYGSLWLLFSTASQPPRGNRFTMLDHLGWQVGDLDHEFRRITGAGARVLAGPTPISRWRAWLPFVRSPSIAFVESPGRVLIELIDLDR